MSFIYSIIVVFVNFFIGCYFYIFWVFFSFSDFVDLSFKYLRFFIFQICSF